MKVLSLNPVNFAHKKGTGMKDRKRIPSNITSAISAQEGGITACHLVLIYDERKDDGRNLESHSGLREEV